MPLAELKVFNWFQPDLHIRSYTVISLVAEKLQAFEDKGVTSSVLLKHVRGSLESGVGLVNNLADDLKRR